MSEITEETITQFLEDVIADSQEKSKWLLDTSINYLRNERFPPRERLSQLLIWNLGLRWLQMVDIKQWRVLATHIIHNEPTAEWVKENLQEELKNGKVDEL